MFWRRVVASTLESQSTARVFVEEQGKALAEGSSFSGHERDLVALNRGDGTYLAISGTTGLDSVSDGRSAVFADFDNDGDTDVFLETMHGATHLLFSNNIGQDAGFVRVDLRATAGEPAALGAVVRLRTSQGVLTKVKAASGFLGQGDPRLLFGLGEDEQAAWLKVSWPGGEEQTFAGPRAGESLLLVQGEPEARRLIEKRFQLPDALPPGAAAWANLKLEPGDVLPSQGLQGLEGGAFEGALTGRPATIVNLWATWCVPCRREMPELQRAFEREGWPVVGVSVDRPDSRAGIPATLSSLGVTYPVAVASSAWLEQVFASDQVQVPMTFVLDGEGRVRELVSGWSRRKRAKLQRALDDVSSHGVNDAGR